MFGKANPILVAIIITFFPQLLHPYNNHNYTTDMQYYTIILHITNCCGCPSVNAKYTTIFAMHPTHFYFPTETI